MVSIFMGKIQVVVVAPNTQPESRVIDDALEAFQEIVGGYIEVTRDTKLPGMLIVVNEEGKLLGLPWNRRIKNGGAIDYIAGTFFVVGIGEYDFTSLDSGQVAQAIHRFTLPKERCRNA